MNENNLYNLLGKTNLNKQYQNYHIQNDSLISLLSIIFLIEELNIPPSNINLYLKVKDLQTWQDYDSKNSLQYIINLDNYINKDMNGLWYLLAKIPYQDQTILDYIKTLNINTNKEGSRFIKQQQFLDLKDFKYKLTKQSLLELIQFYFYEKSVIKGKHISDYFSKEFYDSNYWSIYKSLKGFKANSSALLFQEYLHDNVQNTSNLNNNSFLLKYDDFFKTIIKPIMKYIIDKKINIHYNSANNISDNDLIIKDSLNNLDGILEITNPIEKDKEQHKGEMLALLYDKTTIEKYLNIQTNGPITIKDSPWLISFNHDNHKGFMYALNGVKKGQFINKTFSQCKLEEIKTEFIKSLFTDQDTINKLLEELQAQAYYIPNYTKSLHELKCLEENNTIELNQNLVSLNSRITYMINTLYKLHNVDKQIITNDNDLNIDSILQSITTLIDDRTINDLTTMKNRIVVKTLINKGTDTIFEKYVNKAQ